MSEVWKRKQINQSTPNTLRTTNLQEHQILEQLWVQCAQVIYEIGVVVVTYI
jgi:hypothetical protein